MLAAASMAPLKGAATQAVRAAVIAGPPEDEALTAPSAPSTTPFTLAATPSARSFMPMAILRTAGRFFSMAALYLVANATSAAPSTLRATRAGVHSSLPDTLASQLALHSALTLGGSTWPEHLGAFIATEHLPEQLPLHSAAALSWQEPSHLPAQEPLALPLHSPSHLPLHSPLLSLPSHLPLQVPPQVPLKCTSHEPSQVPSHLPPAVSSHLPSHLASHSPESSPPSHLTSALPPWTLASQWPAQSAIASIEAEHFGGWTSSAILALAPILALASPITLMAA